MEEPKLFAFSSLIIFVFTPVHGTPVHARQSCPQRVACILFNPRLMCNSRGDPLLWPLCALYIHDHLHTD